MNFKEIILHREIRKLEEARMVLEHLLDARGTIIDNYPEVYNRSNPVIATEYDPGFTFDDLWYF